MAALTTDQLLDGLDTSSNKIIGERKRWEVLVKLEQIIYGKMKTAPTIAATLVTTVPTNYHTADVTIDALKNFTKLEAEEFIKALKQRWNIT